MTVPFNSCKGQPPFDPSATPANGCPEVCDTHQKSDHHSGDVPNDYFVVKSSTPGRAPSVTMPIELLDQGRAAPDGFTFNDRIVPRSVVGKKDSGKAGHHIGINEGRLRSDLRQVARAQEPLECALHVASIQLASSDAHNRLLGQAYADLAVTGRNSFAKFRAAFKSPKDDDLYCASLSTRALPNDVGLSQTTRLSCPKPRAPIPATPALVAGCHQALRRAHSVAQFLRDGEDVRVGLHGAGTPWFDSTGRPTAAAKTDRDRKQKERASLGWVAVSGEDDQPHRPVNVPSSDFPQYDILVNVEAPNGPSKLVPVHTRYTVAQSRGPASSPRRANDWLSDPKPQIPGDNAEILLFIHGMDSRAEEANDITQELFKLRERQHITRNLVVIAVDLPTSGYAENLDHRRVSDLSLVGHLVGAPGLTVDYYFNGPTPLLDFIEQFIVNFVDALDKEVPIKGRIKAVMGGSLGGNMSFRLGRRANTPWLPRVIVWSPASIWDSLGRGSDITMHQGPHYAMKLAGYFDATDPDDLSDLKPNHNLQKRTDFFGDWDKPTAEVAGIPIISAAQSDTWTSDHYLCKESDIAGARLDREETYDPKFLTWHWRLGGEQLLFSHQTIDATTGLPRYMSNCKPMLLSCGTEDNVPYNQICLATQKTVPYMRQTPGRAIFLEETGHSLDNERRAYFATEIQKFLGEQWAASSCKEPEKKPEAALKGRGVGCTLPGECASHKCDFLDGVLKGLKCY